MGILNEIIEQYENITTEFDEKCNRIEKIFTSNTNTIISDNESDSNSTLNVICSEIKNFHNQCKTFYHDSLTHNDLFKRLLINYIKLSENYENIEKEKIKLFKENQKLKKENENLSEKLKRKVLKIN